MEEVKNKDMYYVVVEYYPKNKGFDATLSSLRIIGIYRLKEDAEVAAIKFCDIMKNRKEKYKAIALQVIEPRK